MCFCKHTFIGTLSCPCPFILPVLYGCFLTTTTELWVVVTETIWPLKPKIFSNLLQKHRKYLALYKKNLLTSDLDSGYIGDHRTDYVCRLFCMFEIFIIKSWKYIQFYTWIFWFLKNTDEYINRLLKQRAWKQS